MEGLCSTIVKTDSENWDQRNRAVLQMTEIIRSYEDQQPNVIADAFTPNVFRALKEPVKLLVLVIVCMPILHDLIFSLPIINIDCRFAVSASKRCVSIIDITCESNWRANEAVFA